jgi:hypothetical protein
VTLLMLLAGAPFTSHCINLHSSTTAAMLQQDLNIGEVEGDVLKQAGCVASSVSMLCTTYKELAAAAATKGDTTTANSTDGVADHTEPMAVQMPLESIYPIRVFRGGTCSASLPLRECEVAEVHSIVTDAIAGNRGASVLVRGPAGSGKYLALCSSNWAVKSWCRQYGKLEPIVTNASLKDCEGSTARYCESSKLTSDCRLVKLVRQQQKLRSSWRI